MCYLPCGNAKMPINLVSETLEKFIKEHNILPDFEIVSINSTANGGANPVKLIDEARAKASLVKSVNRSQAIIAHEKIELFNDYIYREDYNIDFSFYIHKVEAFIYYRKKSSKGNHRNEGLEVRQINLFE